MILQLPDSVNNLNTIISNGKRFMAYELVSKLKDQNQESLLHLLSAACSDKEKAKGQKHKVFEPSFDAKPVYTLKFLYQKIDYIHHNPVSGKWNLCIEFTDYSHSSAAFYFYNNRILLWILMIIGNFFICAAQGPLRETLRGRMAGATSAAMSG